MLGKCKSVLPFEINHSTDAFEDTSVANEFEWTATMININVGYNRELFDKCRVLEEYSIFIQRVRVYNEDMKDLTKAINQAIEDCIRDNILKDILETQKKEVIDVVLTEFDENRYAEILREDGRKEGEILQLCKLVAKKIVPLDAALEESNLSEAEFMEKMKLFGFSLSS